MRDGGTYDAVWVRETLVDQGHERGGGGGGYEHGKD